MTLVIEEAQMGDEEASERERILALEVELTALRRLLEEQRSADRQSTEQSLTQLRNQMVTLSSAHERMAPLSSVGKMETRVEGLEAAIIELKTVTVPRSELQVRLDAVATRQETMAVGLQKLDQNLVRLSDEWQDEGNDRSLAESKATSRRNLWVAAISAAAAVAAVVVSLVFSTHAKAPTYVEVPTVTAPSTVPPHG